jgi:hypothetical protein
MPLKSVKSGIPHAAKEFLRFLDPNAVDFGEPFAFQTYDDDKARNDRTLGRRTRGR